MSESESEDEILDRIEAALRKIAGAMPAGNSATPEEERLDREALAGTLDKVIARLREGLDQPPAQPTE